MSAAAHLLYIPGGLIALLAESLACCLCTQCTETVPPNTNVKLLEEQIFWCCMRDSISKKICVSKNQNTYFTVLMMLIFLALFLAKRRKLWTGPRRTRYLK